MSVPAEQIRNTPDVSSQRGTPLRKALLMILFTVLLIDMDSNLGIGIGGGLSGKNLLLYIGVIIIGVQAATRSSGLGFSNLDVHTRFLLLISYAMVTIFIASAFSPTYNAMRGIITLKNQVVDLYLLMFVYCYGVERRIDFVGLLKFVVVTMLILSFITLIDFLNIPDLGWIGTHKGRIEGPFGSANQYGALLAFLLPISIAMINPNLKKWRKMIWWIGILISASLLLATGSRGAYLSSIVGSAMAVFLLRKYLDMRLVAKYAAIAFVLLFLFIIVFMIFNADLLLERLEKSTSTNIYVASSGRLQIWTAAILVMLEWPISYLVGNGWNSFSSSGIWKSAHNEYMDRWYELGLIGLALFVSLLFTVTTRVRRHLDTADPELRRILIGYVFGLSIVMVNVFFVGLPDTWVVIWIIVGLVMGLQATAAADDSPGSSPGSPDKTRAM